MRNGFPTTAMLFCLAVTSVAAELKKERQPQSNQLEQIQMVRNQAAGSMDDAPALKNECRPETDEPPKNSHHDPEGNPQASQNQVEYGGGG